MNIILPVIAMLSAPFSAPMAAQNANAKTIIIDNRDNCGEGRMAEFRQKRAESDARKIKRELESKGELVNIVRINPGSVISNQKGFLVIAPRC